MYFFFFWKYWSIKEYSVYTCFSNDSVYIWRSRMKNDKQNIKYYTSDLGQSVS